MQFSGVPQCEAVAPGLPVVATPAEAPGCPGSAGYQIGNDYRSRAGASHVGSQGMSDPLLDRGGEPVDGDSIRARLSQETQERVDATLAAWFGNESELAQFDEDTVKELGKNTI